MSRRPSRRRPVFLPRVQALESRRLLASGVLLDAGFESPAVGIGAPGDYAYDPPGTPWAYAGQAGVAGNGSGFTSGGPDAPEGTQVGLVQNLGSISQSVAGWAAGSYVVTFQAAQRDNFTASDEDFRVTVDGAVVATVDPSSTSYGPYATGTFTVAAGAHTIAFVGLDTAGGDNTAFLDSVAVVPAVQDAGFERPSVGTGASGDYAYDPPGTPWAYAGQAGVAGNGSGFTSGGPDAPEGTQVGLVQNLGSISQSVAGWAAGRYVITFQAAQRDNFTASDEDFRVTVDGNVVGTFTPAGAAYASYATAPFAVAAGAHTIAFVGLDTAGGDNTAFLDSVAVEAADSYTPPVIVTPVLVTPAAASPADVTGTTTQLSVGVTVGGDPSALTYTWTVESMPQGAFAPQLSDNESATAGDVTATFTSAGDYTFQVTADYDGFAVTSQVTVTVEQTLTGLNVWPATPVVRPGATVQFSAEEDDQFGAKMKEPLPLTWKTDDPRASIDANGLLTDGHANGVLYRVIPVEVSVGDVRRSSQVEEITDQFDEFFHGGTAGTIASGDGLMRFSTTPGNFVVSEGGQLGTSPTLDLSPNINVGGQPLPDGGRSYQDLYIDFTHPVNDYRMDCVLVKQQNPIDTTARIRVYQDGTNTVTVPLDIPARPGFALLDLSMYKNITRIEIVNISDNYGIQYLGVSYTSPALDPHLTAHRTGDFQGQEVMDDVKLSDDPSKYNLLVDDNHARADGTPALYSDTADLPGRSPGGGDDDLAEITLSEFPTDAPDWAIKITLSDPSAVRLFKDDGSLMYQYEVTSDSVLISYSSASGGYLDGLRTGDLKIWVEGVHSDSNFDLAVEYAELGGIVVASDDVHMSISDWTFRGTDGHAVGDVEPIWEQEILDDSQAGNSQPWNQSDDNSLYKNSIVGLAPGLTKQLQVVSQSDPTDSYTDTLLDTTDGAVSSRFQAVYDPQGFYGSDGTAPITSSERSAILAVLGINLVGAPGAVSTLLVGQAGVPTDKFSRKVSGPDELPVTMDDADGVYNDGQMVTLTVTLPHRRMIDNWTVLAKLSDGRTVTGQFTGPDPNTASFTFPVKSLALTRYLDGNRPDSATNYLTADIYVRNTYSVPFMYGYKATIATFSFDKSLTLAVLPAGRTMSVWQVATWKALQDGNGIVTGDPIQRNEQITRLYTTIFNKSQNTVGAYAFEWAGMAAFASYSAGVGMKKAQAFRYVGPDVAQTQLRDYLGQGNIAIFSDMYSQMLAYSAGKVADGTGLTNIKTMADRGDITPKQLDAWENLDLALKGNSYNNIWLGQILLAQVEQYETLQAVLDLDPLLWRAVDLAGSPWLLRFQTIPSPIPGDTSTFQSFTHDFPNASFADPLMRYSWTVATMVPAMQNWRKTHPKIDINILLQGGYKKLD